MDKFKLVDLDKEKTSINQAISLTIQTDDIEESFRVFLPNGSNLCGVFVVNCPEIIAFLG